MNRDLIGTEVINISETVEDGAVVLLNDELFEENDLDADEQFNVVKSLFILAYDHLNIDLRQTTPTELIEISPDPIMFDLVSMVRMILMDDTDFQLLVYFGGRADPSTTLRKGLIHILEVLAAVEMGIEE